MKKAYLLLLISAIGSSMGSCKKEDPVEKEIATLEVNSRVSRFEQRFADAGETGLNQLKTDFPFLFPTQFPDSVWIAKMKDSLFLEMKGQVDSVFTDFSSQQEAIHRLNQHWTYYFPADKLPHTITLINERDYERRIILADSLLLIGLDNYLGQDHHFYSDLPRYVAQQLQPNQLLPDIAATYSKRVNRRSVQERTFLDRMVHYGKELYIKEKLLPEVSKAELIGYSPEHWAWAENNEAEIWRHIIENELLYSTESTLDRRFLDPAPFSKFGLELDSESPGRIGRYIGWKMVQRYAEKNTTTLGELVEQPANALFKASKYKPKK